LNEYGIENASEISLVRLRAMNANDLLVKDDNSWDISYDYDFTNINDVVLNIVGHMDGNVMQLKYLVSMKMKFSLVRAVVLMNGQYHIMEQDMMQQKPLHRLART
jgi:hypothetical protein